ncbi:beta-lactamase family protein [Salmonella enterica]|nr:beta-lactamase family protein [Salmonella enterica]
MKSDNLPQEVYAIAEQMRSAGVGSFSIGSGVRENIASLVNFGDMKPDTRYPIASASKFLTAATVMSLVDEGCLSLDRGISAWLPELPAAAGKITLRYLLSQTSGLAGSQGELYELAQDHRITLAQSAAEVTKRPLISEPGEVFAYGGPGFQVAGAVVESVTGKRWCQVFQDKIAGPLGMINTYWTHLRLDSADELPVTETQNPVLQGGAVSTAEDYLNFLSMLAQKGVFKGRQVLSATAVDEMLADQTSCAKMTPTGASVLPDAHYALGNWCEVWNGQGEGLRNSSIGYFGVYPWIEKESGRFGLIFPYIRENAFRFWPEMEAIRNELI